MLINQQIGEFIDDCGLRFTKGADYLFHGGTP